MEEEQGEVTILNELGSFDKLLIWYHESMVDGDDPFVKGLAEWIGFAEAVSGVFSVWYAVRDTTVADMINRLDAYPRKGDRVRMGAENCASSQVGFNRAKS